MVSPSFLLATASLVFFQVQGLIPSCNNSDSCLELMKDTLTRTTWWFGDSYSSSCPEGSEGETFTCTNPDRENKTIISRILHTSPYNIGNITQVLRVRFYVPAGFYLACGHRFNVPAVNLDQDISFYQTSFLDSWTLRNRPAVIWEPEPGVLYTLATYNVDLLQLAGLWVNIKGGDSSLGYELYPYTGPGIAINKVSIHAFVLFRQTGDISEEQFDVIRGSIQDSLKNNGEVYRLSRLFALVDQIKEPVGMGMIPVGPDPYSIERFKSMSIHNNCPWLISRMRPLLGTVADFYNLTALGANVSDLEVEVEVTYRSDALQYMACCKNVSERALTLKIDPLSQSPVNPVYLRSQPFIRFGAVDMMDSIFFLDKLYALLLLDVTWATAAPGPPKSSILWLVTDIQGLYITSGITRKNYTMPRPPLDRTGASLYTFFVFRQSEPIRNFSLDNYCSTSSLGLLECDFDLYKFVMEYNLHLSGVNWLWSQLDLYARLKTYESDEAKMDTACAGVKDYSKPCPDKCAPSMATTTSAATQDQIKNTTQAPGEETGKGNGDIMITPNTVVFIVIFLVSMIKSMIT